MQTRNPDRMEQVPTTATPIHDFLATVRTRRPISAVLPLGVMQVSRIVRCKWRMSFPRWWVYLLHLLLTSLHLTPRVLLIRFLEPNKQNQSIHRGRAQRPRNSASRPPWRVTWMIWTVEGSTPPPERLGLAVMPIHRLSCQMIHGGDARDASAYGVGASLLKNQTRLTPPDPDEKRRRYRVRQLD